MNNYKFLDLFWATLHQYLTFFTHTVLVKNANEMKFKMREIKYLFNLFLGFRMCNYIRLCNTYLYSVIKLKYWYLHSSVADGFCMCTSQNKIWSLLTLWNIFHITVTSQWSPRRPKSPASQLLGQPFIQSHIKENIKAPRQRALWGESTGDRWIPLTKSQSRA